MSTFSAYVLHFMCAAVMQCELGELVCMGNGSCIPHSKRCDDTVDCPAFNSDESSCYGKADFHLQANTQNQLYCTHVHMCIQVYPVKVYWCELKNA